MAILVLQAEAAKAVKTKTDRGAGSNCIRAKEAVQKAEIVEQTTKTIATSRGVRRSNTNALRESSGTEEGQAHHQTKD